MLNSTNVGAPVILSLQVAFLVVIITALLGLPLSRLMARGHFMGRDIIESIITLPLVLPPSVTGYALLILVSKNGLLGGWLESIGFPVVFTWRAIVLASLVVAFPLFYRSARAAIESVNPNYEQAARTLGAGELKVFLTVTLPLARQGIIAGLVLSFARSLGEFGATLMVAGNIPGQTQTIPTAIYFAVEAGHDQTAQILVALVTLISFGVIYWVNYNERQVITQSRRIEQNAESRFPKRFA